jgi:hypothetical protein
LKIIKEIGRCLAYIAIVLCCNAPALAQTAPAVPTGPLPTDLTPIRLREERELFQPGTAFYAFQKLPANFWFNISAEENQRFESNVFLTANQPRRDYVFRSFPNTTVGYNVTKNTGVYINYFLIKDVYNDIARLTIPTTQSLSLGLRRTHQLGSRTSVQFDFQARELWQAKRLHQFDYIPGMLITRVLTPKTVMFVNIQMQMRGGDAFVAPTREIDPFYTVGFLRSFGLWTLSISDTFITDYRSPAFHHSVPKQSNAEMISDIEIYHPLWKKHPGVVAFVRAEPIWNWASNRAVGLSGFDFRLYSGLRLQVSKPPLTGMISQMRKELKVTDPNAPSNAAPPSSDPSNPAPPNSSPSSPSTPAPSTPAPNNSTTPVSRITPDLAPQLSTSSDNQSESVGQFAIEPAVLLPIHGVIKPVPSNAIQSNAIQSLAEPAVARTANL